MEIKVGEYIRDCVSGEIGKVVEVNPNYYRKEDGFKIWRASFKKIKHSPNIIDIIECGDYVNGKEVVYDADASGKMYNGHKTIGVSISNDNSATWTILDTEIREIVTKQQFDSRKYIVGDESNE